MGKPEKTRAAIARTGAHKPCKRLPRRGRAALQLRQKPAQPTGRAGFFHSEAATAPQ